MTLRKNINNQNINKNWTKRSLIAYSYRRQVHFDEKVETVRYNSAVQQCCTTVHSTPFGDKVKQRYETMGFCI